MKRLTIILLAAALSACSQSEPAPDPQRASEPTTTSASAPASPATVVTTVTEVSQETHIAMASTPPPASSTEEIMEQLRKNPGVGAPITINGQKSTICIYGDGFALKMVAAGENTSCEFAKAVFRAQTDGLNPTGQNVRDYLQSSVDVMSPVTNQSYTMHCSTAPNKLITCLGGNNATVFMI
ncbi:hypothetical protein HW450_12685 [Corynebacterium hindlerae]|uniref:Secreted protein n=1 Tax=Corynebacterium hindlerae TaxID=699041 RepID=A0A7G5FEW5_9CORY|nr:hypothetical protein [Corynebacterium hindlerae]QMV85156.1 hypothetical protein HW450_12685 [Corynebacterium hindlerae]